MDEQDIRDLLDGLLSVSPESADRDELGIVVGLNAKLKAFTVRYDMRCSRRADELAAHGLSESGFGLLIDEGNGSANDAKAAVDRDRVCSDLPVFDTALANGDVSAEHLDLLARHTRDLSDAERSDLAGESAELVEKATTSSAWSFERELKNRIADIKSRHQPDSDVEELERQRRDSSVKRWTERGSGMKVTMIKLDPVRDATLHAVVDAQLARLRQDPDNKELPFERLKVMALLAATSARAGEFSVAEIVIHTDATTVCAGRHAHTMCETVDGDPVPVATMHRFCCEAILTAVMVEVDGTVRTLSEQRTANRHQRRALSAMYSTCAHPHCTVPFTQCRIHHVVWFTNGGPTLMSNMAPLCETHHHLVHEGGWSMTMTADRTITWIRPDGSIWSVHQSINRQPDLREHRERQRSRRSHAAA